MPLGTAADSSSGPSQPRKQTLAGYDSSSESDAAEAETPRSSLALLPDASGFATRFLKASHASTTTDYLFPAYSSTSSTSTSTPVPSRSTSPLPQFFVEGPEYSFDTDSEPDSPNRRSVSWSDDNSQRWWAVVNPNNGRSRRTRSGKYFRKLKKWAKIIVRHPLFPKQPIFIVLTLLLFSLFAVSLTLLIIYIVNPDKEPLPWRAYCSVPATSRSPIPNSGTMTIPANNSFQPPFPPDDFDSLPPAGVFVGVFSMDSAFERRMLVRSTWARHDRSRNGATDGDNGLGTSRTIVRFILGQPRKSWEQRIKLEMELFKDIVILPVNENMNNGKTHAYFTWASTNAWVPPVYFDSPVQTPRYSYSNQTSPPPPLAPHDPNLAQVDREEGTLTPWVRPDFTLKADDDSFVMLAELEARLRYQLHMKIPRSQPAHYIRMEAISQEHAPFSIGLRPAANGKLLRRRSPSILQPDPLVYWGYLVKNRFMGGELYALSWSLVNWIANDPVVKGMTRGAEDKTTARWIKLHPRAQEIRWASERCWIYDHPRAGTVYSHGFLFPSEVNRVQRTIAPYLNKTALEIFSGPLNAIEGYIPETPESWALSSVSTFGVRYQRPIPDLGSAESVEALVEGSTMSKIREGGSVSVEQAWAQRENRNQRYSGQRVGGTIVVHFVKKHKWFLETALALLEGSERPGSGES